MVTLSSDVSVVENRFSLAAVLLAAGVGQRSGLDIPKQFLKLAGRPVLEHTLRAFARSAVVDGIIVVAHADFIDQTREICDGIESRIPIKVVVGGATRQESSLIGIQACEGTTHVMVHDAVRPLVSQDLIRRIAVALRKHDAIDVCVPATDTIVIRDEDHIASIPRRNQMMLGQTPQAFRRDLILRAHQQAIRDGIKNATDDCALVLRQKLPVFIEAGERSNIKITYLDDVYLIERLLRAACLRQTAEAGAMACGIGKALVLGGTKGIGQCIAAALTQAGAEVHVASRHTDPRVDVSSAQSIMDFVEKLRQREERFDALVYCPGTLIRKTIFSSTEADWDLTYDTNIKGVFHFLQKAEQLLNVGGHFLVLGSSSYSYGRKGYAAYSSSKAALINLIEAAADEHPAYHFNVVSPQRTATGLRMLAFGESEFCNSLLDPNQVAEHVLEILQTETSGMNFDVRIDAPLV